MTDTSIDSRQAQVPHFRVIDAGVTVALAGHHAETDRGVDPDPDDEHVVDPVVDRSQRTNASGDLP
jgi:hypothetical protein